MAGNRVAGRVGRSSASRPLRAVVFDFDGTLVDSNKVKRAAYYEIFARRSGSAAVIDQVLRRLPTATRFEVIGAVLDGMDAPIKGRPSRIATYARRYNAICESYAAQCAEIPGASACLKVLHPRYLLFLSSATPRDPLVRVVRKRGWLRYFEGVFGWPPGKPENLKSILKCASLRPEETVCIGDCRQDWKDARMAGCRFVGVSNRENSGRGIGPLVVEDLKGLEAAFRKS